MISPLLPHYTEELGLSKASAGVLTGAYSAGVLIASLPAGLLVVRFGARAIVIAALGLLGGASLVFGFAEDATLLQAARFVQGVGGACTWSAAFVWVVDEAPDERRGELIGALLSAAIAGNLLGPVVGAVAEALGTEVVFSAVVAVCAALVLAALALPAPLRTGEQGLGAITPALRGWQVRLGVWLVIVSGMTTGVVTVLGPIRLDELGAGAAAIAAVFVVTSGVQASIMPLAGRLSDRRGPLLLIRLGLAATAVLWCLFTVPSSVVLLGALILALMCGTGTYWGPAMALLSDAATRRALNQGLIFAVMNLAWGTGHLLGSSGGGAVAGVGGDGAATAIVAGLVACTLAAVVVKGRVRVATQEGVS